MKWTVTPIGLPAPYLSSVTYAELFAALSFPVFAAKNVINFVQLWKASKILVGVDIAERKKAREDSLKSKKKA